MVVGFLRRQLDGEETAFSSPGSGLLTEVYSGGSDWRGSLSQSPTLLDVDVPSTKSLQSLLRGSRELLVVSGLGYRELNLLGSCVQGTESDGQVRTRN